VSSAAVYQRSCSSMGAPRRCTAASLEPDTRTKTAPAPAILACGLQVDVCRGLQRRTRLRLAHRGETSSRLGDAARQEGAQATARHLVRRSGCAHVYTGGLQSAQGEHTHRRTTAQGREIERLNGVYTKLLRNAGVTLFGAAQACHPQPARSTQRLQCAPDDPVPRRVLWQRGGAVWRTRTRSKSSWRTAA
jgi:hypothetical protein